ncbi:hypothetical protein D9M70_630810 [compost metagenome]
MVWPRALCVKRWKDLAAAAKKNHITRMSMTTTVVMRTVYCDSSGCSGRMNCGMNARKNTMAFGLSRLTHRPRRNMDHAGSFLSAAAFSWSRSGLCRNCLMPRYTRYAAPA